ncbi:hypothetical protein EJB00_06095 [Wolbachia endosymbiont of Drosophila mauritiana]|nr:hypothetical protein EJA99_06110 [Wolbachia endosymbiont of Drosophila mauritiana]QCB64128.1 hypothetical protein EJB00_06095 [Wolbachia endosymbiont of Drosophila mauritiana]TGB05910.1 hypothetical protein E5C28_05355 [Wolbachia endosymbiont of Drosophila mauritiana]
MKSLYEGGMKTLLDKPSHFSSYINKREYLSLFLISAGLTTKLRYLLADYIKIIAAACFLNFFYFSQNTLVSTLSIYIIKTRYTVIYLPFSIY